MAQKALMRHLAVAGLLVCILMTASCGHRKETEKGGAGESVPAVKHGGLADKAVAMINAGRQTGTYLTAKASIKLKAGQKDVGVSGTLRMKRDDVIQVSMAFLGLMEVGRLELTQGYMLLVDRVNHQYVKVAYSDIPQLKQAGVDFYTFQSLFWDELFLPGSGKEAPPTESFEKTVMGDSLLLVNTDNACAALHFIADMSQAVLVQTSVVSKNAGQTPLLSWNYSAYKTFDGKKFPTNMQMKVAAGAGSAQLTMNLSNLKANSDWETRTVINSKKYKQVSVESIMNRLKSLSL